MIPVKIFSIFLVVIILSLSGCSMGGGDSDTPQAAITTEDVCDTNQGVTLMFEKGLPPSEVFVGDTFYASVMVQNLGCSDTSGGTLYLSGIEKNKLQVDHSPRFDGIDLLGKSVMNPFGDFDTYTFDLRAIGKDPVKKTDETVITASLCYPYETIATGEICINPRTSGPIQTLDDVCQPGFIRLDPSQGAPVVVSAIDTKIINAQDGTKMQLNIYVEKRQAGIVVPDSTVCWGEPRVTLEDVTFADYSLSTPGANQIVCSPANGTLVLSKKSNNMYKCIVDLFDEQAAYTTPLQVRLSYGFLVATSKKVIVRSFS